MPIWDQSPATGLLLRELTHDAGEQVADSTTHSGADLLAEYLVELGVRRAFGLMGGAVALCCDAFRRSGIEVIHARHETGAALMAIEAHFATDRPVAVFTTTGPGATNALTGLVSAAWEGAKIIMISGATDPDRRGRDAFQETGHGGLDLEAWVRSPADYLEFTVEDPEQLPLLAQRLAAGFSSPTGMLANLTVPTSVQKRPAPKRRTTLSISSPPQVRSAQVEQVLERVRDGSFVIWAGFGARRCGPLVRALAERAEVPVMCTARAKGVFPESHPQYLGVTGMFGAHPHVFRYFEAHRPRHVLVLGTRLGEYSSGFDPALVPSESIIHVDLDRNVFGRAYPQVETLGVCAHLEPFLAELVEAWPACPPVDPLRVAQPRVDPSAPGTVHPRSLMAAIQRVVVEGSEALVISDTGNAFAWTNLELRFDEVGRYRTATGFATMMKATAGVVGAAMGRKGPAVAVVGDGAMLMGNEVSTAVQYRVDAKWIILNDASYGMVRHGMNAIGMEPFETEMPKTDFATMAGALGATGLRVSRPSELVATLETMMSTEGPVVVDVTIDPRPSPPFGKRNESLTRAWE